MSSKSYVEIICQNAYWLIQGRRVDVTRLSRRSFMWKAVDEDGTVLGRGRASSAEGALNGATHFVSTLKSDKPRKSWYSRLWGWLANNFKRK